MRWTQCVAMGTFFVFAAMMQAGAVVWTWDTAGDTQGWTAGNSISSVAASGGDLVATYNGGGDPNIYSPADMNLNPGRERVLIVSVDLSVPGLTGAQDFQIFYRRDNFPGDAWESHSFHFSVTPNVGSQVYVVNIPEDLASESKPADWADTIDRFRFDIGSGYTAGSTCRLSYMTVNAGLDWKFDTAGDAEGWGPNGQINVFNVASGSLEVGFPNVTTTDPYMTVYPTYFDCSTNRYVRIRQNATGHNDDNAVQGEIHAFPSSISPWTRRAWYFYPNVGNNTIIVDMSSATGSGGGQWSGLGTVTSWRLDNTTDALTNWQPSGRIYYDRIRVTADPLDAGPYLWDFSGSGPGSWVAAKHGSYGNTNVSISGGVATVTPASAGDELAMANFDLAADSSTYHYLVMDLNVVTTAARTDFPLRFHWKRDGAQFGDRKRLYTVRTNAGYNRYVYDLFDTTGQPSGHTSAWGTYVDGVMFEVGEGETDLTAAVFGNVELVSSPPPFIDFIDDANVDDGVSYSQTPTLLAGAPVSWTLVAPASPPGDMAIDPSTGELTWTATYADSPVDVTVRATNAYGTDDESWQITVNPLAPVINALGDDSVTDGGAYSRTPSLSAGTGPITWSLVAPSPAPGDMAVDPSTGELTWTAVYAESPVSVTIQASGPGGTDTEDWVITVNPITPVINALGDDSVTDGGAYSRTPSLSAGTGPITWSLVTPSPAPGDMAVNGSTGELTWTADYAESPVSVTIEASGPGGTDTEDWVITVNPVAPVIEALGDDSVTDGLVYSRTPSLSQGTGPITWSLVTPSPAPGDMAVSPTTGELTWTADYAESPVNVTIRASGPGGVDTEDWLLTVDPVAPQVFPIGGFITTDGSAFSMTPSLVQGSGTITWSLDEPSPLLGDMAINPSTGQVTWTTQYSATPITMVTRATGPGGTDTEDWSITVNPIATVIAPIGDGDVTDGAAYSLTPSLQQGTLPVTWSLVAPSPAPGDMAVDPSTGELTWTADYGDSPVDVTIQAAGPGGTDTEDWQITVTFIPKAPIISAIDDASVPDGQSYSVTPVLTQGTAPITWSLVAPSPAPGDMAVDPSTGELTWTADYGDSPVDVTVQASGPGGTDTEDWRVTVDAAAPVIGGVTVNPASGETALGGAVDFTVQVTQGTAPLSYAWSKDGVPISGATDAVYAIASAVQDDEGAYTCTVTNMVDSATSAPVNLLVGEVLSFSGQPLNQHAYVGGSAAFSVSVAGGRGEIGYQWKFDDGQKAVFDVGSNTPTLTISPASAANEGAYWCVATDDRDSYTSSSASLAVAEYVSITEQPESAMKNVGQGHTFSVTAAGGFPPLTYQWWKDGLTVAGATLSSLAISDIEEEDEGEYMVEIADSETSVVMSNTATLTVDSSMPAAGAIGLAAALAACLASGFAAVRRNR